MTPFLPPEMLPPLLRFLHRDELVLVVDKPAGVLSVPGRGPAAPTMWSMVRELVPGALPVHRLDRDTTGAMIFGLGKDAHRTLNAAFEARRAEKTYLAIVRGDFTGPASCALPIADGRKGGMRIASGAEDIGQPASTDFVPAERFGAHTLVVCKPKTGRRHQIRVHLAALGHPLLVDPRYGDSRAVTAGELCAGEGDDQVLARTPLHASAIRVPSPSGKGWLQVEAPLPDDLQRCLDLLRSARRNLR